MHNFDPEVAPPLRGLKQVSLQMLVENAVKSVGTS